MRDPFSSLNCRRPLPRCVFTDGTPTPIEPAPWLARAVGRPCQVAIKRDDQTSRLYGGNKPRKLEFLLGRAIARERRAVVTLGAYGSHHALATAIFAREVGLSAHLVLYPQPPTSHVRENLLADLGAGATLHLSRSLVTAPLAYARAVAAAWRETGRMPARIPAGGSNAWGALGYVACGLEIAEQIARGEAEVPDHVYVACGTAGTQAGLAVGLGLGARRVPALARTVVHGVRVVPAVIANLGVVCRLMRGALRLLQGAGASGLRAPCRVGVIGDQLGQGYGHATEQGTAAVERAKAHPLTLEPTYTAKAVAGLVQHAGRCLPGGRHLYVHTLSGSDLSVLRSAGERVGLPPVAQALNAFAP